MHKNAQKVEQKTQTKLPATTPGCSMVKIARLDDAFLEVFEPQVSPLEGQLLQQKEKKRRKRKVEKKIPKIEKPKDVGHFLVQKLSQNFDFCAYLSQNVAKRNAVGKKAKLS